VLTAKVFNIVFDSVEKFKADAQLANRNAAINALLVRGLCSMSYLS